MRWGGSALVAVALLVSAAPASGLSGTYVREMGDVSANSLSFKARVKFTREDKFTPVRVRNFNPTVQFSCFDSAGVQISTSVRGDFERGFADGLKVRKRGSISGTSLTSTGLTYVIQGRLRRSGRAAGSLQLTQGQRGSSNYCSTGSFADPTVQWKSIFLPHTCCAQPTPVKSKSG